MCTPMKNSRTFWRIWRICLHGSGGNHSSTQPPFCARLAGNGGIRRCPMCPLKTDMFIRWIFRARPASNQPDRSGGLPILKAGKPQERPNAADVVELVYTRDLKSLGLTPMRVQVPPSAPNIRISVVGSSSWNAGNKAGFTETLTVPGIIRCAERRRQLRR